MKSCEHCGYDGNWIMTHHYKCQNKGETMKYKDFEDYLAEKCHILNPSLDDDCVEIYEDWIADLEPELFIAYGEQYKNICVNEILENLGKD